MGSLDCCPWCLRESVVNHVCTICGTEFEDGAKDRRRTERIEVKFFTISRQEQPALRKALNEQDLKEINDWIEKNS